MKITDNYSIPMQEEGLRLFDEEVKKEAKRLGFIIKEQQSELEELKQNNPKLLENKELIVKQLEKYIEDIFFSGANKIRKIVMKTGRGGAIQNYICTQATLHPEKDLEEIKKEANSLIWENGVYTIDETGCHYEGLWDYEIENGVYLIRRNNLWYKEAWKDGYRYNYQIISEEVAQELIKQLK